MKQPNLAARPSDAPNPIGASVVRLHGAAPISFAEAAALVEEFHYSHSLPKTVKSNFGAWDNGVLIAAACYGPCVGRMIPKEFLELRRLVRRPTGNLILSQFLADTLKQLKARGVAAVISYADPMQNHHGGIYQATNWIFTQTARHGGGLFFRDESGNHVHARTVQARCGTEVVADVLAQNPLWTTFREIPKFRYVMPLCLRKSKTLELLNAVELPYPKPTLNKLLAFG